MQIYRNITTESKLTNIQNGDENVIYLFLFYSFCTILKTVFFLELAVIFYDDHDIHNISLYWQLYGNVLVSLYRIKIKHQKFFHLL